MRQVLAFNHTIYEPSLTSDKFPANICFFCENEKKIHKLPKQPRYPYLAKIGTVNDGVYHWSCGGAIISPKYILSTSYCILSEYTQSFYHIQERIS